jgi:acetoin utilization deacetylase AcuC-like enzyme
VSDQQARPAGEEVQGLGSITHQYYERDKPQTGVVLLPGQESHDTGEHPENKRRLPGVVAELRSMPEWDDLFVLAPRAAKKEDILRAHTEGFYDSIEKACAEAPNWLDTDTCVSPGSLENCLLASGGALSAVDAVAMEAYHQPDSLFTISRPPGHHTGIDKAMGFCLFNHISVAARYAKEIYGFDRVAILDWDVHHGNGTQEIHWKDPSALFISLHQWPLYPGIGWVDEIGEGDGEGSSVNIPMPPGSGDPEYLQAIDEVAMPIIEAFDPQLLLVSAGQDGHAADPLSNQLISKAGFNAMASRVATYARSKRIGLVVVHEGGYNVTTLPGIDRAILAGLGDFEAPLDDIYLPDQHHPPVEWPRRLAEVIEAQKPHWDVLR